MRAVAQASSDAGQMDRHRLEVRLHSLQQALELTQSAYKDELRRREDEEEVLEQSLGAVLDRSAQLQQQAEQRGWVSDGSPARLSRLAGMRLAGVEQDAGWHEPAARVGEIEHGAKTGLGGLAYGLVEKEPELAGRRAVSGATCNHPRA